MNAKDRIDNSKPLLTVTDIFDVSRPADRLATTSTRTKIRLTFCDAEQVRARKVVTRSRFRSTGKYPSWKMERMLQWESVHERNAFRLLDANPQVKSFNEQPCKIEYTQQGKRHNHTPDILVEFKNGMKEFWEVKTAQEAANPETAARTMLLTESLPSLGYHYRVILAEDLQFQPRLRNTLALLRHGFLDFKESEREIIRLAFKQHGELLWSAAADGQYGRKGLQVLCNLVLQGVITIDMDSPITSDTCFVIGNGGL